MANQQNANYRFALKKQAGLGSPASGGSAIWFDVAGGAGVNLEAGTITDPTIRSDGQKLADGSGMRWGTANYQVALGVAKSDFIWPSMVQISAWNAALALVGGTDFTSITTQTDGITFVGYNPLNAGWKRGMKFKLTGHSTPGNNGRWLFVWGATSTRLLTGAASLTADAGADASVTIDRQKYAYAAAVPVKSYYTIEDYGQDINSREVLTDALLSKVQVAAAPNAKVLVTMDWVGLDVDPDDTTGSSIFTSPVKSTGYNMEMSDGFIMKDGVLTNAVTDFQFTFDKGGTVDPVLGSVGDDVDMGLAYAQGTINAKRRDLQWIKGFKAKSPFEFAIVIQEPESDPKDGISMYFGYCTRQSPKKSIGQTGSSKDAVPFTAGVDEGGGDRAAAVVVISSTAP